MTEAYRVLGSDDLAELHDHRRDFAYDVLVGLSEKPKQLSSRYFYDDEGSRLFQEIMESPEYYLTGAEREILEGHAAEILRRSTGEPFDLVDLGAGDGAKTCVLLEHLLEAGADVRYVPIDISEGAMGSLADSLLTRLPGLSMHGLVSEYVDGVHWLSAHAAQRPKLVLFLGSNIGNFNAGQARAFLRRLWSSLAEGDRVLVGFDLKKDIDRLLGAYNDARGVTARFNVNLLARINRELGANFELEKFRHFSSYDVFSGAMESYLVSLEEQRVFVEAVGQEFHFEAWEPVHTEYSYKYLPSDIRSLAADTGFVIEEDFHDAKRDFVDSLWRVERAVR
ncbi:MAG: L-histidine N(alpha)-methyltransferase [Deltaproteobacteria bacterium]|nr:L-histidine N(alpha)-methyltransferase [Deltaproteobacteria bacterium]